MLKRMLSSERKRIFSFEEGSPDNKHLLGIKGATLCRLTQLGLPVPPGFVISTDNFAEYLDNGEDINAHMEEQYIAALRTLEQKTHRKFGARSADGKQLPLLLAVRAGTAIVVPGMMDTVLNVGMTDTVVTYLSELNQGYTKFALDLQRRFIYMFGTLVLRIPTAKYERVLARAVERDGVTNPSALSVDSLLYVVSEFKEFTNVPEDPYLQLRMVIEAMYQHSFSPMVSNYLDEYAMQTPQIPRAISITVQAMVYGNLNSNSGCGVAFSRHLDGSSTRPYGEYLSKSEGQEVLEGDRPTQHVEELMRRHPNVYQELLTYMRKLEERDSAIQYVEFTIENGELYILETSDVNLRPNTKDSRFVIYYDLLQKLQQEEEEAEGKRG